MKKTLLFTLSMLAISVYGQTTLTYASNVPTAGDAHEKYNLNNLPFNNTATGNNATFDNAALTLGALSQNTYAVPTATEIADFPGTNVAFSNGAGISIFYKTSTTALDVTAITASTGVLKLNTNNATIIKFPTAFGDSYTDTASGRFLYSTYDLPLSGTITTTADAAGTLIVGSATFTNVLRLKIVQNYTIFLSDSFPLPAGTATITTYLYFDGENRYPIAENYLVTAVSQLAGINESQEIAQVLKTESLAVNSTNAAKSINFYPNPAKDFIFISDAELGNTKVNIFSVEGKLVKTLSLEKGKSIDVQSLTPGNYILQTIDQKGTIQTSKLIKK